MRETYYAAAGLGYGVDLSHFGAPYQGMLGLGSYVGEYVNQPLAGLGATWPAGTDWSPGPGQIPADDPRMVRQYATVRSTYSPRNVTAAQSPHVASLLLAEAQRQFAGNTVRMIGTTGWTADGQVGYEVILAVPTRAGEIKQKNKSVGDTVSPTIGGGASLYNALTTINPVDIQVPPAGSTSTSTPSTSSTPGTTPSLTTPPSNTDFFSQTVGGIPVWAVGLLGVAVVGGVAVLLLGGKKTSGVAPAAPAPTANRRRHRRRRS